MSNKKSDKTKKAKNVENVIIAPEEIPVIVVKNLVLFPGSSMQFDLDSKRAIRAVEAAMLSDGRFFLLSEISEKKSKEIDIAEVMVMLTGGKDPLENDDEESKIPEVLHNGCIGTIAKTTQVIRQDNGIVRVQVAGLQRAMLTDFEDYPAYFVGHVEEYSDLSIDDAIKAEALRRLVIGAGEQLLREYGAPGSRELKRIRKIRDLDVLTNDICSNFPLEEKDRLNILQTVDLELRCKKLIGLLSNEKSIMNARKEISEQISRQVDEHQREYILREQLSYIQSELNDDPDEVSEVEQYKKAAEELVASDEVKAKLKKEIRHFEQNGGMFIVMNEEEIAQEIIGEDNFWAVFKDENGSLVNDDFAHEQCLRISCGGKDVLFSGCAHSGVLNVLERYAQVYGGEPDYVISGFHLSKKTEYIRDDISQMQLTAEAMNKYNTRFVTCHCTGEYAYRVMKEILGEKLEYVHCGEEIILSGSGL